MKNKFLVSIIAFLLFLSIDTKAQTSIYGELLGAGFITTSINVEHHFDISGRTVGLRAGWSWKDGTTELDYNIPLQLNFLLFKKKHKLELAAGSTYFKYRVNDLDKFIQPGWYANLGAAYRYTADSGFLLRISTTYFLADGGFLWPGLGLGWSF